MSPSFANVSAVRRVPRVAERDEVEALQHATEVRRELAARVRVDDGVGRVEPGGLDVAQASG